MTQRLAWIVAAVIVGTGCISARIEKPDVIGPHGEHLVELACNLPDQCMALARETCGGDYDIVTSNDLVSGGGKMPVSSQNMMLVQCKSARAAPPITPPATPRDASH